MRSNAGMTNQTKGCRLDLRARLLTSLSFLLRCRDQGIIPRFLQFRHHIRSQAGNRIYKHAFFRMLRERIHHSRRELVSTSRDLLEIHILVAVALSEPD